MIIEGAISVKAAISSKKRNINEVYIDKNKKTKDFNYIRKLCRINNIKVNEINKEEFSNFNIGKTFGGIIADVDARISEELNEGDIFLVDGVEDPFNIGYILRSLYALGVNNVILPLRDYSFMEAQILKSSAGAYDYIHVNYSDDFVTLVKSLKNKYHVYGLRRSDESKDIFEEQFKENALFLLGGEKRGLSADLENLCDDYLYIPYGNDYRNALNACSACAIVATLLFKQRK